MDELTALLGANTYPGRGLVLAGTAHGALVAYFVTGRSPASQQREIRRGAAGELLVSPLGEGADDPLRHYAAARTSDDWLVVGNGRQVDTVLEKLEAGHAPQIALDGLEHEPDAPIFTDRITLVVSRATPVEAVFGVARRSAGGRTTSDIHMLVVREPAPGDAVLLTTYKSDGETIEGGRPFLEASWAAGGAAAEAVNAAPKAVNAAGLLDTVWAALEPRYRVAAMALDPAHGLGGALIRNERR
ncbi:MAG TPA: IMP cyclohydrolase [Thermoleophilia bacterium]|nr:IMP cyclohydrolase [Thermoleophilia bacterium]